MRTLVFTLALLLLVTLPLGASTLSQVTQGSLLGTESSSWDLCSTPNMLLVPRCHTSGFDPLSLPQGVTGGVIGPMRFTLRYNPVAFQRSCATVVAQTTTGVCNYTGALSEPFTMTGSMADLALVGQGTLTTEWLPQQGFPLAFNLFSATFTFENQPIPEPMSLVTTLLGVFVLAVPLGLRSRKLRYRSGS